MHARRRSTRSIGSPLLWSIVGTALLLATLLGAGTAGATTPAWQVDISYPPSQVGALHGIACPSSTVCYVAAGDSVLVTTNAGATWSPQSVPSGVTTLRDVGCSSVDDCVAMGGTSTTGEIVWTDDAGSTWTSATPPAGQIGLAGVSCAPATSDCIGVLAFNDVAPFIISTDGGSSWTTITSPGVSGDFDGVTCLSAADCVAVGDNGTSHDAAYTTDGGSSWSYSTLPSGVNGLQGVACTSTSDCLAVGGNPAQPGYVLTTSNGAVSWSQATVPAGTASLNAVACLSSTDCIAVGSPDNGVAVILGSSDGGTTWTSQAPPSSSAEIGGVACPPTAGCVAVGSANVSPDNGGQIIQDFTPPLTVTTTSLPAATPGTRYDQTLTAAGGTPPYTWKLLAGSKLPKGLKLHKGSGVISGTPKNDAKSETFTVEVTDSADETATATLTIAVS